MTHDQPPLVGEGIYGEGQPLSADDDIFFFFFGLQLEVAIPEWNPPFNKSGSAPELV